LYRRHPAGSLWYRRHLGGSLLQRRHPAGFFFDPCRLEGGGHLQPGSGGLRPAPTIRASASSGPFCTAAILAALFCSAGILPASSSSIPAA
jgi:hypothetical protein